MINVLIVDDHQVLADGIKALVGQAEDVQIQHHAMTGKAAMEILQAQPEIQLILLDINLPDTDGVKLCHQIKKEYPEMKVLALTMHHEPGFISRMIK
ncbi:MAG: response regulator transcription factor, partial [Bacteroidota bacterium]